MKKLAELRAARAKAIEDQRALLDEAEAESRELTEAEDGEFKLLEERAAKLAHDVEREEKLQDEERKLTAQKLEVRDKAVIDVQAKRYKALRGFEDNESAFRMGMWTRAVVFGDTRAQSWCNDNSIETRVMGEGVFTKGGALVPEEFTQAIIDLRERYGTARQLCRVIPMASDTLTVPRRTGGVTAYFVGENAEITASDKSWDNVQLTAKKLGALCKFSTEYAEDAVIDVASDLANEMAYAFAVKEDQCWIDGDGTSTYGGIHGLRPKIITSPYTASAIDAATGHDTFAEIDADDLASIIGTLPMYAEAGAKWLISKMGKALVFDALASAAGGNTAAMMGGRLAAQYLGYEIALSMAMPSTMGDQNNTAMLFLGNFMQSTTLGDRRGFNFTVLRERYAEFDQIGIVGTERFEIVNHDLGDTTAAGPVVALIAKTS